MEINPDSILKKVSEKLSGKNFVISGTFHKFSRDELKKIIEENMERWIKNKNYVYKNMVFKNYSFFINYFCMEHNSQNCRKILYDYLNKCQLSINLYKKNTIKYIK